MKCKLAKTIRQTMATARKLSTPKQRIDAFLAIPEPPAKTVGRNWLICRQNRIRTELDDLAQQEKKLNASIWTPPSGLPRRVQKRMVKCGGTRNFIRHARQSAVCMVVLLFRKEIGRRGGEIRIETKDTYEYVRLSDGIPQEFPLEEAISFINSPYDWVKSRLFVLRAEGWRQYSRGHGAHHATLSYLCGVDDSGRWAVRIPGTIESVSYALGWIKPAAVYAAECKGKTVVRQGDVYCVPTTKECDGTGELPRNHIWDPETRMLYHNEHRAIKIDFPVKFYRQKAYVMGRSGRMGDAD